MSSVSSSFDSSTGVGRVKLDRPEVLNAFDVPMARSLRDEVEKLISQQGLRAIVLHASGRAFCGGGDVASFVKSGIDNACSVIDDLLEALHPTVLALRQTPAPVITAVHGVAAGAGLSLALAGDLIVATEDSKFLVAYERLGAPPDCGLSWFLPRRVGRGLAFRMMLTSAQLSGAEASACGMIDQLVSTADFDGAVQALAEKVASGPTMAFGQYKELLDCRLNLADHLEAERHEFLAATRSDDFAAGVKAFISRVQPIFAGK